MNQEEILAGRCESCGDPCFNGVCVDCFSLHEDAPKDERLPASGIVLKHRWIVIRSRSSRGPWKYHNCYETIAEAKQRSKHLFGKNYMAVAIAQQLVDGEIQPMFLFTHSGGWTQLGNEDPIPCSFIVEWPDSKSS